MTQHASHSSQRGAALITVLVILLLVSGITMAMLSRQQLDIRRTASVLQLTQAQHYVLGAETLALQVLARDASEPTPLDHGGERWAQLRDGVALADGATLVFTLEDQQGRLNLNTLIGSDAAQERFTRLLALLDIPTDIAPPMIAALGTREDPRPLRDVTQLRSITGVTAEDFSRLAPFITALPASDTPLNVNTAPAIVLAAYIPGQKARKRLNAALAQKGFLTRGQLNAIGMNTQGMGVTSEYFALFAQATMAGRSVHLTSLIARRRDTLDNVEIRVVQRDRGSNQ